MSERGLRFAGIVLLVAGFALWFYGFVYSSFWYANAEVSILEPVRVWVSEVTGQPVVQGAIEEIIGLVAGFFGIPLQVISYYMKR